MVMYKLAQGLNEQNPNLILTTKLVTLVNFASKFLVN